MSDMPEHVYMVQTTVGDNLRYHYVGAEDEEEARALIGRTEIGDVITGIGLVKNVERVGRGECREYRAGEYIPPSERP
jgi:hypothetical protein